MQEVLRAFARLGLTAFGGPVAHLGYFRTEFVERRRWLSDADYADLVALCQFLPGPASSQVGFALGLGRAGLAGALAAFIAFTLPSALLLVAFAALSPALDGPVLAGFVDGLKLAAVAVVAHAVLGMARSLCPDRPRTAIALLALALVTLVAGAAGQLAAILAGMAIGLIGLRADAPGDALPSARSLRPRTGLFALAALIVVAALLPALAALGVPFAGLADGFFRAGALVFGGGHVVLPLLEAETVATGLVAADTFLAGYGAAQAVPGPLFTFAAYLGFAAGTGPAGALAGSLVALVAIFLPGFLLLLAALPFWDRLKRRPRALGAVAGANAAVVGVLGAALYDPVFTSAVRGPVDFLVAVAAFLMLTVWRVSPLAVVAFAALCGLARVL